MHLLFEWAPLKKSVKNYTGEGSSVELGFHIENNALRYFSYEDCSPKCLLLEGVKQQDTPPYTSISDGRDALKLLSDFDIRILSKPLYKIKLPYRQRCNIKD